MLITASLLLVGINNSNNSVSVKPYSEHVIKHDSFVTAGSPKKFSNSLKPLCTSSVDENKVKK